MSNLVAYAKSELERAGMFKEDSDYGGMMGPAVLKMVELFSAEGHSGMSASLAIALFERVARFEPLTPLTGEPDEWNEVGPGMWQNNRCSYIFKDSPDGQAYNSQGRVFRYPDGGTFVGRGSRVPITFPWSPSKPLIVDVDADGNSPERDAASSNRPEA